MKPLVYHPEPSGVIASYDTEQLPIVYKFGTNYDCKCPKCGKNDMEVWNGTAYYSETCNCGHYVCRSVYDDYEP